MTKEKRILKDLYNNDSVSEALYCQCVSCNDFIKECKDNIKCCKEDIKNNINIELCNSQITTYKELIKEYQTKRKQLKKALKQIYNYDMSDYNA